MFRFITSVVLCVIALQPVSAISKELDEPSLPERYRLAERFLAHNLDTLVYNNQLDPHWISGRSAFWYRRGFEGGHQFFVVDVKGGTKEFAFDHLRMAKALGAALGSDLEEDKLPIDALIYEQGATNPKVIVTGSIWSCDLAKITCDKEDGLDEPAGQLVNSDGTYAIFLKDHNIWMRDIAEGEVYQLTKDGSEKQAYAILPESNLSEITFRRSGITLPPIGLFSPDGSKFVTYQLDQSEVKSLFLVQSIPDDGSRRPVLHRYRYPFPGEPKAAADLVVFDLAKHSLRKVLHPPIVAPYLGPVALQELGWSDNHTLHLVEHEASYRQLTLTEIDANSGEARAIRSEMSDTSYVASHVPGERPLVSVLENGQILWPSERSGRLQLYRYDSTGHLMNAVSGEELIVREIIHVDEHNERLYFSAVGDEKNSDPYYRALYSVNLDGSNQIRLTPEDADHQINSAPPPMAAALVPGVSRPPSIGFSPDGFYFVDSYSTPELPTTTVVRDWTGRGIMKVETAELSKQLAQYKPPESFMAIAADGKTPVYGSIFKPSHFDPTKKYPVIDSIYPGPQVSRVSKRFLSDTQAAQSIAELGFIVVSVDGRGTPFRSKKFRSFSYGNLGSAGALEDHIAALTSAAKTRPFMDLEKVGIYGSSGGGFATVRAMFDYPEFYDVGVAAAGNHDHGSYISVWGETYQGPYDPEAYKFENSYVHAEKFNGKLLLAHGEMDDNVHPMNTMKVVDALIKNNKYFDLLIMPNINHGISANAYFNKRRWDYFLQHLRNEAPDMDYVIGGQQ